MPKVRKNESRQEYVSRCIPFLIKHEGKSQKQAKGQCYGMYKQHKKK